MGDGALRGQAMNEPRITTGLVLSAVFLLLLGYIALVWLFSR